MAKRHIPPHSGPFWAYSLTLRQGVALLTAQKSEVPETSFLDVVATHNDHSTYLNHVLGSIYVFTKAHKHQVSGQADRSRPQNT